MKNVSGSREKFTVYRAVHNARADSVVCIASEERNRSYRSIDTQAIEAQGREGSRGERYQCVLRVKYGRASLQKLNPLQVTALSYG